MAFTINSYLTDPWATITQNERTWYDPLLREVYVRQSVYSQLVNMYVDLNAQRTRKVVVSNIIPPRPYTAAIPDRETAASRLYTDSYRKEITVERYGNGISINRESELFSYWQRNGNYGLVPIIQQSLGQAIVDHMDLLARAAFLTNPYALFGTGTASSFAGITASDRMSTELLDSIWLGLRERRVPWAAYGITPTPNSLFCITSPGVIHDLKREVLPATNSGYVDVAKYADGKAVLAGQFLTYRNIQFIETPLAILWNCGPITQQANITAAVKPGDGAPDPNTTAVDNVLYVGQPDATHYIQVNSVTNFKVGDMVTVHKIRATGSSKTSVTNGVDFRDPMLQNMEIVAIDTTNNRLVFREPYMMTGLDGKGLETEVTTGVYGYVTKGRHIHTAVFLSTDFPQGVIAGVTQLPRIYTPPAIDDFLMIYRITYDMWMKYQLWEPQVFEVWFGSAPNRHGIGPAYI